jgi:ATP-binding cassette, subfamily B, bacterial PglK
LTAEAPSTALDDRDPGQQPPEQAHSVVHDLRSILSRRDRMRLLYVICGTTVLAAVEVASLAAFASFMLLVTAPQGALDDRLLVLIKSWFAPETDFAFAAWVAAVVIASIIVRNIVASGTTWYRLSVIHGLRETVATRLLRSYLGQPFSFFYRTNSATLAKNVTLEIDQFVSGYVNGIVVLISDAIVSAAIIAFMISESPGPTLIILLCVGALAVGVILLLKNRLGRMGHVQRQLNEIASSWSTRPSAASRRSGSFAGSGTF